MTTSQFEEKGGVVQCQTPWGRWWQTISEIHIEVDSLQSYVAGPSASQAMTKARDIKVDVKPKQIRCQVHGKTIFEGKLCRTVVADETVWTIRRDNGGPVGKATASADGVLSGETLDIQLTKADPYYLVPVWSSLLLDGGQFAPDAWTFDAMRRRVDLDKFQIENPGFDFSKAKLSKTYD